MKYILIGLVFVALFVALVGAAMIRFRGVDVAKFHVEDPDVSMAAGKDGQFFIGPGGDMPMIETELGLSILGSALADLIEDTPRTTLLAGSLTSGGDETRVASYVTRSAVLGFPDVTTVKIQGVEGGAQISMHGRQVYGVKDFGVNAARLRAWAARFTN